MYNKSITFPLLSLILLLFTACKDSNSPCISTQLEEKQIGAWVQTHNKTESEIIKVNPCYIKENSLHSLKEYFGFKPKTLAEENTIRNQLQADTNYTVATYYIDAQNGSDDNSGTSKDNAWNTIRHMQSQKIPKKSTILLKRGQTHWIEDSSDSIKFTGNNGYILVSAYGEGEMPIIEPKKNRDDIIWTNNNDGTWSTTVNMLISRMWINNKEVYKSIPEENEKIDKFYPWEIIKTETESKINLLSSINPNNQKVEFYQRENSILINKNGLHLANLDIRGAVKAIQIYGSEYNIIKNCKIGLNSIFAIHLESSSNVTLDNVKMVSGQVFKHEDGSPTLPTETRYGTKRGAYEGIRISKKSYDNNITNITLNGWTHAAYNMYNGPQRNKFSNFLIESTVLYGDSIAVDYKNTMNNEIFNGYLYNLSKNHQFNGTTNKFYNNIIYKVSQSGYSSGDTSMGISMNPHSNNITANEIFNNTIINTDGPGILIKDRKSGNPDKGSVENVKIYNNIFYNCGANVNTELNQNKYGEEGIKKMTNSSIVALDLNYTLKGISMHHNIFFNSNNNSQPFVYFDATDNSLISKAYNITDLNRLSSEKFTAFENYTE